MLYLLGAARRLASEKVAVLVGKKGGKSLLERLCNRLAAPPSHHQLLNEWGNQTPVLFCVASGTRLRHAVAVCAGLFEEVRNRLSKPLTSRPARIAFLLQALRASDHNKR